MGRHRSRWDPDGPCLQLGAGTGGDPWLAATGNSRDSLYEQTAEEVKSFRAAAGLKDPFIVENGGAIHGETSDGDRKSVV